MAKTITQSIVFKTPVAKEHNASVGDNFFPLMTRIFADNLNNLRYPRNLRDNFLLLLQKFRIKKELNSLHTIIM